MRATGIVRRFDDLGRIVIPKELRKQLFGTPEKSEGMPMEIFMDKDDIVLRKYIEHISDDVCEEVCCEWKHFSGDKSPYRPSCKEYMKSKFEAFKIGDYCTFCGKKIKIVGD